MIDFCIILGLILILGHQIVIVIKLNYILFKEKEK